MFITKGHEAKSGLDPGERTLFPLKIGSKTISDILNRYTEVDIDYIEMMFAESSEDSPVYVSTREIPCASMLRCPNAKHFNASQCWHLINNVADIKQEGYTKNITKLFEYKSVPQNDNGYLEFYEDFKSFKFKPIYKGFFSAMETWKFSKSKHKQIRVLDGNTVRISDKVNPRYLKGCDSKNPQLLRDVKDPYVVTGFLYKHTHWGARLCNIINHYQSDSDITYPINETDLEKFQVGFKFETDYILQNRLYKYYPPKKGEFYYFAKNLWSRICAFICGHQDPLFKKQRNKNFDSGMTNVLNERQKVSPNHKKRIERFLEILTTIDGIFTQRYISIREEHWDWVKYDLFVLYHIDILLGDEFLDDCLSKKALSVYTRFKQLKQIRKHFKMLAHREKLSEWTTYLQEIDPRNEFRNAYWLGAWEHFARKAEAIREKGLKDNINGLTEYVELISYLSQTRCCGTPPPICKLQARIKYLETITKPVEPYESHHIDFLNSVVHKYLQGLPKWYFTGLATKARLNITNSACLEVTRVNGGTEACIADIITENSQGCKAFLRDLDTGKIQDPEPLTIENEHGIGTYIFFLCLDIVLKTSRTELQKLEICIVNEPAKNRVVTKGPAALKIVLDVVSKICAYPLSRIPSSSSGMSKGSHGWEFWKGFFTTNEDMIFDVDKKSSPIQIGTSGKVKLEKVYKDVFAYCTDFIEATDSFEFDICRVLITNWMNSCGIPRLLKGIVLSICVQPRTILFLDKGNFYSGETTFIPHRGKNYKSVKSTKGIPMGDPMTKVAQHLSNIIAREISCNKHTHYNTIVGMLNRMI